MSESEKSPIQNEELSQQETQHETPRPKPNYRGLGRATIIGRLPSGLPITTNALQFEQVSKPEETKGQEE